MAARSWRERPVAPRKLARLQERTAAVEPEEEMEGEGRASARQLSLVDVRRLSPKLRAVILVLGPVEIAWLFRATALIVRSQLTHAKGELRKLAVSTAAVES